MKSNLAIALLPVLIGAAIADGAAATYYTSSHGSDSNPGTLAAPFLTIAKGVLATKAGDTLYVMTGVYNEVVNVTANGTSTAHVTVMAYPGDTPVIDGGGALPSGSATFKPLVGLRGTYDVLSGFEIRNTNPVNYGTCMAISGSYSTATALKVHNCHGNGIILSGSHGTISNSSVSYAYSAGIVATSSYGLIQGNTVFENAYSNCRATGCPNSAYQDGGWAQGITVAGAISSSLNATKYNVVTNNTVYNNWGEGIGTYQANNTRIENNIAYDNWALQFYISDAQYITTTYNLAYVSSAPAIALRPIVQHYCFSFADEKSAAMRSENNTLAYNYCIGGVALMSQTQVPLSYLTNFYMANNTIVNGTIYTDSLARGSKVANNIIDGSIVASVPASSGISWVSNAWLIAPPPNAKGTGTWQGDPKVSENGSTLPGRLTTAYFTLLSSSPIKNAGIGAP